MRSSSWQKWILALLFAGLAVQLWLAYGLPYARRVAYQHDLFGEKGWWDQQAEADMKYREVSADELQEALERHQRGLEAMAATGVSQVFLDQALRSGDYEALERRFNDLQARYESGAMTDVELLELIGRTRPRQLALAPALDTWVERYPASYYARLLRGLLYRTLALEARGARTANKTAASGFAQMHRYFERADLDYRASLALAQKPVLTHAFVVEMATFTGDRERADAALQEANRVAPDNFEVRSLYMFMLQSRWLGSNDEMWRFLVQCEEEGVPMHQLAALRAMQLHDLARSTPKGDRFGAMVNYEGAIRIARKMPWLLGHNEFARLLTDASAEASDNGNYQAGLEYAQESLRVAPKGGCGHCMAAVALVSLERKSEAIPHLETCSADDESWCQYMLGMLLYEGYDGVRPDRSRGLALLRQAAAAGEGRARNFLKDIGASA
jgi:hypothetical protein